MLFLEKKKKTSENTLKIENILLYLHLGIRINNQYISNNGKYIYVYR